MISCVKCELQKKSIFKSGKAAARWRPEGLVHGGYHDGTDVDNLPKAAAHDDKLHMESYENLQKEADDNNLQNKEREENEEEEGADDDKLQKKNVVVEEEGTDDATTICKRRILLLPAAVTQNFQNLCCCWETRGSLCSSKCPFFLLASQLSAAIRHF